MAISSIPLSILILILSVPVVLLYSKFNRWLTRSLLAWKYGCKEPPRPNINLDEINRTSAQNFTFLDTTTRLFNDHGKTYKTRRGGRVFIRTCQPEVSKAVLSTHFEKFGLQPIRYEGGKSFFGNGMLVTDGAQWKTSRALIRPTFDVAHIANLDRLGPFVDRFMGLLPRDGSTVDLFPLFKRLTLDISSDFIFGRSMEALASPDSGKDFMDAFHAAQRDVVILNPALRSREHYKGCQDVWDYIDARVDEAFARMSGSGNEPPSEKKHVRIIDELVKTSQDRISLRFLVLSIFMPAHDNVAVALSNAFFHLARNPGAWTKLRAEIMARASEPLTYELLCSFKYLNWVLRETHRLTPLNSGTVRTCLETTVLPVGGGQDGFSALLVEKGDIVELNFRSQQRDKSFWGDDADEFRPERWDTIRPTWEYIPFSGGPRICPALKLVYAETEYIMVRIVREFAGLENRDEVLEWVEERRLTFQSRNGAKVALVP
ncbi:n-alkane-inducible cytochrome P450 [Byssothecium circinans]|uniref:N-alkane-inducible cytochrome P450 n=1 Tax=Byssothecium circinans TaxID=147558 RepID=A0A6A5U922_9PLEO|nr:n-alkane-inducible cytochrome P450 [Byssothecium circinans]